MFAVITRRRCDDYSRCGTCSTECNGPKVERRLVDNASQALYWVHHEIVGCEYRTGTQIMDPRFEPFYDMLWETRELKLPFTIGPLPAEDMVIEVVEA